MSEQNKIEQIKARHAAATPGPWKFSVSHREYGLYGGDDRILSFGGRVGFDEFRGQEPGMDDEVFIQHSWDDVQHLLAEIERKDEALKKIAEYDVSEEHGSVDEWSESQGFAECQRIAREAL